MSKARILVVEDRFVVAEDIANSLRKLGYEVGEPVMSGEEAIETARITQPDLVLMDIHLKGVMDGIDAAHQLKSKYGISVVYLTAHSDDSTLQRASATSPLGYLLKPFEERQLYTTIELALNRQRAEKHDRISAQAGLNLAHKEESPQIGIPESVARTRAEFAHIIGHHPALLTLLEKVELVAKTDVTVHIFGENGTGKELIADAVHRLSARRDSPFVKLNCSAIPATLLESALFGHVKGSFTGATRDQQGFVEHAEKGTLFLDEIGDLSSEIQVKLLRLLQSREYSRVGESITRKADLRIITATNRNLKELVKENKIREDFFYRIHVFPLIVPSLRERQSDIKPLAQHFRAIFNQTFNKKVSGISEGAMQLLERYRWPGNIRELENAIRHAFVVVPNDGIIGEEHLPPDVASGSRQVLSAAHDFGSESSVGITDSVAQEQQSILSALEKCNGNKTRAAKLLGYSRVTLWKKLARLGMVAEAGHDIPEEEHSK